MHIAQLLVHGSGQTEQAAIALKEKLGKRWVNFRVCKDGAKS